MQLERFPARHQHNDRLSRARAYGASERAILSLERFRAAKAEIAGWPGYRPTPLIALPGLARRLDLGAILYKDEGKRFGLKSFKALGGAYAVLCLLKERLAAKGIATASAADLVARRHAEITGDVTMATATDGNHGRSVAWGAQMFGCRCIIYLHEHVSEAREREIARYGAEIRRVSGSYDDSVRRCAAAAAENSWLLVADTSSGGDARVPAMVMQGYTLLVDEMMADLAAEPPTHVFVPGAVGGLAAAVVAQLWESLGERRPRIVVVEPTRADCISRSLAVGRPTPVPGDVNSFMACLAAGEVSPAAWDILGPALDDSIAIPDEAAVSAMRLLAEGTGGDPSVVSGESGCAAIAGLVAAALDSKIRKALDLTLTARVVTIGSEGATDEETYRRVVGESADSVERRAA